MSRFQTLTQFAVDWARRCFGDEHMNNAPIRALRALEEITEAAQVVGLPVETARLCIERVYSRPVGKLDQELGGSLLTVALLCASLQRDPEEVFEREVRRVLAKSRVHFAKRNQNKLDVGLTA